MWINGHSIHVCVNSSFQQLVNSNCERIWWLTSYLRDPQPEGDEGVVADCDDEDDLDENDVDYIQ